MQSNFTDPDAVTVTVEGARKLRDHWRSQATDPKNNAATRLVALTAARNWSDVVDSLEGRRPARTGLDSETRSILGYPRRPGPPRRERRL